MINLSIIDGVSIRRPAILLYLHPMYQLNLIISAAGLQLSRDNGNVIPTEVEGSRGNCVSLKVRSANFHCFEYIESEEQQC